MVNNNVSLADTNGVYSMRQLNEMTDEILVGLYLGGNNNAFDVVLKRYESNVFSYLYKAVGNQELAEDIFQDIFIKVVMRLKNGQYSEHGKFSSWLMRLVHNHVIDFFRTSPKLHTVSNDDEDHNHLNDRNIAINENREQEYIDRQTIIDLKNLIDMLPEMQREVLMMRFFDELSFKEIAEKTECGINTALGRMHYAIKNLRRLAYKFGFEAAS